MKKILNFAYKTVVMLFKKFDKIIGYKLGNVVRVITNNNTRKHWDRMLRSFGQSWQEFPYQHLLEFLPKDYIFSLLDIGCALGDGCLLLKKHFPQAEINGVDFSKVAIRRASTRTNQIKFFLLDIIKEYPPKKYDYITLVRTLEHFNDPYAIVDKCLSFVNRSLIVEVAYTEKFDSPYLYSKGLHRYLFNEETFSKYKGTILKITEMESTGYRYIIYKIDR